MYETKHLIGFTCIKALKTICVKNDIIWIKSLLRYLILMENCLACVK